MKLKIEEDEYKVFKSEEIFVLLNGRSGCYRTSLFKDISLFLNFNS